MILAVMAWIGLSPSQAQKSQAQGSFWTDFKAWWKETNEEGSSSFGFFKENQSRVGVGLFTPTSISRDEIFLASLLRVDAFKWRKIIVFISPCSLEMEAKDAIGAKVRLWSHFLSLFSFLPWLSALSPATSFARNSPWRNLLFFQFFSFVHRSV